MNLPRLWPGMDPTSPLGLWSTVYSIGLITFDFHGPVGFDLAQDRRIIRRREKQRAYNLIFLRKTSPCRKISG